MDAVKSYIAMGAFALLALTACGQMDASAVEQEATKLMSTVAEAGALADGAARGELTSPFVKVHAADLADDAAGVETGLQADKVEAPERARAARLRDTAHRVAALLEQLSNAPGDTRLASRLEVQIDQLKATLARA
jgi:hypothetical protein